MVFNNRSQTNAVLLWKVTVATISKFQQTDLADDDDNINGDYTSSITKPWPFQTSWVSTQNTYCYVLSIHESFFPDEMFLCKNREYTVVNMPMNPTRLQYDMLWGICEINKLRDYAVYTGFAGYNAVRWWQFTPCCTMILQSCINVQMCLQMYTRNGVYKHDI